MDDTGPAPIPMEVGQELTLKFREGQISSQVCGWSPPHVILVKLQNGHQDLTPPQCGTHCQAQYIHRGVFHCFDSEILGVAGSSPSWRFLELSFPEHIRSQKLRAFPRIKLQAPGKVLDPEGEGWSSVVLDLSLGGCRAEIPGASFILGDQLVLTCDLLREGPLSDIPCTVRNVYRSYCYGLEFGNLTDEQRQVLGDLQSTFAEGCPSLTDLGGQRGVVGDLEVISLTDLLQLLSGLRKAFQVDVTHQGEGGRIFLKGGTVQHATVGSREGREAVFELCSWARGRYRVQEADWLPEKNMEARLQHLLLEFACWQDQRAVEEQLKTLSTEGPPVGAKESLLKTELIEQGGHLGVPPNPTGAGTQETTFKLDEELHLESASGDFRLRTKLVGIQPNHCLVLGHSGSPNLKVNDEVWVRCLHERPLRFKTRIFQIVEDPIPMLYLSYPLPHAFLKADQRHGERKRIFIPANLLVPSPDRRLNLQGHVLVISNSGCLVWVDLLLGNDLELFFSFRVPWIAEKIETMARVVRSDKADYGLRSGLKFTFLDHENQERLEFFLQSLKEDHIGRFMTTMAGGPRTRQLNRASQPMSS